MVSTRRSSRNNYTAVELGDNGKSSQDVISMSEKRAALQQQDNQIEKQRDGEDDIEEEEAYVEGAVELTKQPNDILPLQNETRGRKRKIDPENKIETRGRKRKTSVQLQPPDTDLSKPVNKHNINHLLTNDTVLPLNEENVIIKDNTNENDKIEDDNDEDDEEIRTEQTQSESPKTSRSQGRIPITSIISQKIDVRDIPSMLTNEEIDKKRKKRYRVDRDNIKINKRIMSQDTEDVIKMFKKFDEEILTNSEARSRLLSLGFETRKRYITTFKHYIRFCCKKKLENFFVTGDLMKEFYQEQFALSNSNKPVIRLRKMDPAFSKLQEINFLVYHLENKEIPNRHVALEYLIYKELGKDSSSSLEDSSSESFAKRKKRIANKQLRQQIKQKVQASAAHNSAELEAPELPEISQQSPAQYETSTPDQTQPNYTKKLTKKNIITVRESFIILRSNINKILHENVNTDPAFVEDITMKINSQLNSFDLELNGPPPPPLQTVNANGIPIMDLNHELYTVYGIIEEWFKDSSSNVSIIKRLETYNEDWIRDDIDHSTFEERKAIVQFVESLAKECNVDIYTMANDCDRYIREKSILDEFISEIELDADDLFKRILRYTNKRR